MSNIKATVALAATHTLHAELADGELEAISARLLIMQAKAFGALPELAEVKMKDGTTHIARLQRTLALDGSIYLQLSEAPR